MVETDGVSRRAGPRDDDPSLCTRFRRLTELRDRLQDWLWGPDERFARKRGWTATRSRSGWSVTIRDPRFDRRHLCDACAGEGRHQITGADCVDCGGVGVVTDPDRGEPR